MKPGEPAGSAEAVAALRVMESSLPEDERLFFDPWARDFLTNGLRRIIDLCRFRAARTIATAVLDRAAYGQRAFLIARTVFIDHALGNALARGVRQIVILGAGYDSRAYRIPGIERAQVFEVDHPDTQARKREILSRRTEKDPSHIHHIAVDFNRQRLDTELGASGFCEGEVTFVIWEGVTEYLEPRAVDETLRLLARVTAPASELVFTYVDQAMLEDPGRFRGAALHLFMQRRMEELFTFGLHPAKLAAWLEPRGFERLDDQAGQDFVRRYFEPCGRPEQPNAYQHVAHARVLAR